MLDKLDKLIELVKTIRVLDEEKCFLLSLSRPVDNYSETCIRYSDINKILNELFKKIIKIILESDSLEDYQRLGVINIKLSDKKRGRHLLSLKEEIDKMTTTSYIKYGDLQEILVYSFMDDPDSKIIIDIQEIHERRKRLTMF